MEVIDLTEEPDSPVLSSRNLPANIRQNERSGGRTTLRGAGSQDGAASRSGGPPTIIDLTDDNDEQPSRSYWPQSIPSPTPWPDGAPPPPPWIRFNTGDDERPPARTGPSGLGMSFTSLRFGPFSGLSRLADLAMNRRTPQGQAQAQGQAQGQAQAAQLQDHNALLAMRLGHLARTHGNGHNHAHNHAHSHARGQAHAHGHPYARGSHATHRARRRPMELFDPTPFPPQFLESAINPLINNLPDLDYQFNGGFIPLHGAHPPEKPPYEPPPAADEGYSRDTGEDLVAVCAGCDDELAYDPDAGPGTERPTKRSRSRKEREEHPFWAVTSCGHVYCRRCFDNRKSVTKGDKSVFFKTDGKAVFCAVEGCQSDVTVKKAWVGLFT